MNHRILAAAAFIFLAVPGLALAQEVTDATATSTSTSGSESNAGAVAGATNAGNSQNITFEGSHIPRDRLQAPSTTMVQAMPTAPCTNTTGVGGSIPGLSLSVGTSQTNRQCMLFEEARILAQVLGDLDWARELLRGGDPDAVDAAYQRAHPAQ
jgi:hypothetical protein